MPKTDVFRDSDEIEPLNGPVCEGALGVEMHEDHPVFYVHLKDKWLKVYEPDDIIERIYQNASDKHAFVEALAEILTWGLPQTNG